jgi:hypothetical protein
MLEEMREVINPDVIIEADTDNKKLLLKEDGLDSKIRKLYITHVPDNIVAFTLDHQPGGADNRWFQQLSPYVNISNNNGVNKGCDVIIIWQDNDGYFALVFDLKSSKPKISATQKQLDNSEIFLKYLLSMIKQHYKIPTHSIKIRKAIVITDSGALRKGATYRPNAQPTRIDGCHVEVVIPKDHRTGYIALSQLAR